MKRWAACVAALALAGCGGPSGDGASGGASARPGTGSAQITYKPDTHVMTKEEGKVLILGISTNTSAFFLDGANPTAQALKPGDAWLVKGIFARKVLGVQAQPTGEILVLTEPAGLTDLAETAHIAVSKPVSFGGKQNAQLLDLFGNIIAPPAYAQGAQGAGGQFLSSLSEAMIDGWKVTTNPSFSGGKLKIDMKFTRDDEASGLRGLVTVDGYLDGFDFDGRLDVEQGRYERISSGLKKLNGTLNVTWEVASGDGPGSRTSEHRIKLPASVQIPLSEFLEGLPLYLEISSAIIIKPALTGGQQLSKGAFRVNYDGTQNFTLHEGTIDSDGNVKGDIAVVSLENISALAPVGMVVALAAPRIELSFGFDKMFETDTLQKAAKVVDAAAAALAQVLLSPEQYSAWQASPFSSIKLGDAVENSMKSDAAAWFQIVTTSGMTNSGMSVIAPCTRDELSITGRVGASAEAFGQTLGETEKDIFRKEVVHIDPPTVKLCQL